MKTKQKTVISQFISKAKADAEQIKFLLQRQRQSLSITDEIKRYTKQCEESSSSYRHFLDKSEVSTFLKHKSSTIVKTLFNSPSISDSQSIIGKSKEVQKTPQKSIQKEKSQASLTPFSKVSYERIDTSGLKSIKFQTNKFKSDCPSYRSNSSRSNELLTQALDYLNIGNVQRSMKQLAPLLNINSNDKHFNYQVIGALFQCSKILKDDELCLHYSQMYVDNLEGESSKFSTFEIDILMYQLRQRLKKTPFLNSKSVEFIVRLLNTFSSYLITEKQLKHKISLLFKYLIITRQDIDKLLDEIWDVIRNDQDQCKFYAEKLAKNIFKLKNRNSLPIQFSFKVTQKTNEAQNIDKSTKLEFQLYYMAKYLDLIKSNINNYMEDYNHFSNYFLHIFNMKTYAYEPTLKIVEIISNLITQKDVYLDIQKQKLTSQSLFNIIKNNLQISQISQEFLYQLCLLYGKYFYQEKEFYEASDFYQKAETLDFFNPQKQDQILKFKLLMNILAIQVENNLDQSQEYLQKLEEFIGQKIFTNDEKAIFLNEIGNIYAFLNNNKIAINYYQRALNFSEQNQEKSLIMQNILNCQKQIE